MPRFLPDWGGLSVECQPGQHYQTERLGSWVVSIWKQYSSLQRESDIRHGRLTRAKANSDFWFAGAHANLYTPSVDSEVVSGRVFTQSSSLALVLGSAEAKSAGLLVSSYLLSPILIAAPAFAMTWAISWPIDSQETCQSDITPSGK